MEPVRQPFQGILNIIRFNWHFYTWAAGAVVALLLLSEVVSHFSSYLIRLAVVIVLSTFISGIISFYVYDKSPLYTFSWLAPLFDTYPSTILTFHAGFDETSALLQKYFPKAHLQVFDFYDPRLHREISIQRARKAYPAYPNTKSIRTDAVPLQNGLADCIFLILAAHEIRNLAERIHFFGELKRVLKPTGKIIVVEHLRDNLNFLAYNIGFFHFLPESEWLTTFSQAKLRVGQRFRIAHFITVYVLEKDGYTA